MKFMKSKNPSHHINQKNPRQDLVFVKSKNLLLLNINLYVQLSNISLNLKLINSFYGRTRSR
jgi:hypothetical protein